MKRVLYIFFSFLLVFYSCKKESKTDETNQAVRDTIAFNKTKNATKINIKLTREAKKALENWKEYQIFDDFISQYSSISNSEALSNATELSELATHLRDSVLDSRLNTHAVKTRLNILQNECLRLKDMENISAIKPKEVSAKVTDILKAYAALNNKFISVYEINKLQNELELDPDFEKILLESAIDTTKKPFKEKMKKNPKTTKKKRSKRKSSLARKKLFLKKK